MLTDTLGMRPDTELAHRRLCDLIWATGEPPSDNTDSLTDICRVKPQDWMRVRGELMTKGWLVENGKFTHKGTIKTLIRCRERHQKKIDAANAGANGRWGANRVRTESGRIATASTPVAMRSDSQSQPQSQPQPQSQSPLQEQPPPDTAVDSRPKLEWCLDWVDESRRNGSDYTKDEAKSAFLALNAGGWMWGRNPIVDFSSALERQIKTDRQRNQKSY